MKKSIWNKRMPTLLGILMIAVAIGTTTFLTQKGVIFVGQAGPTQNPKDVRITNVSDNSFTISFITDSEVIGSVNLGKDKFLGQAIIDDRDAKQESSSLRKIHYFTAKNLNHSTKYYFSIISGDKTFLNNGSSFEASTAGAVESSLDNKIQISGSLLLPDGTSPKESVVYFFSEGSQVLSTLSGQDGSYSFSPGLLKSGDLKTNFILKDDSQVKIEAISDTALHSEATAIYSQAGHMPTIVLSESYDFTLNTEPIISESNQEELLPVLSTDYSGASTALGTAPKIITPETNQGFSDFQPLFKGTALPNETVRIIIHSYETIQSKITTDSNGQWQFRPSAPLSIGEHTISIITKDALGLTKTITKTFVVFASGTQVEESATPAATLTPTTGPTPMTTIAPTSIPETTTTPTPIAINTPIPTTPPGSSSATNLGFVSIVVIIFGAFLFLLSRGGIKSL